MVVCVWLLHATSHQTTHQTRSSPPFGTSSRSETPRHPGCCPRCRWRCAGCTCPQAFPGQPAVVPAPAFDTRSAADTACQHCRSTHHRRRSQAPRTHAPLTPYHPASRWRWTIVVADDLERSRVADGPLREERQTSDEHDVGRQLSGDGHRPKVAHHRPRARARQRRHVVELCVQQRRQHADGGGAVQGVTQHAAVGALEKRRRCRNAFVARRGQRRHLSAGEVLAVVQAAQQVNSDYSRGRAIGRAAALLPANTRSG